jgi:hypothetical protein
MKALRHTVDLGAFVAELEDRTSAQWHNVPSLDACRCCSSKMLMNGMRISPLPSHSQPIIHGKRKWRDLSLNGIRSPLCYNALGSTRTEAQTMPGRPMDKASSLSPPTSSSAAAWRCPWITVPLSDSDRCS